MIHLAQRLEPHRIASDDRDDLGEVAGSPPSPSPCTWTWCPCSATAHVRRNFTGIDHGPLAEADARGVSDQVTTIRLRGGDPVVVRGERAQLAGDGTSTALPARSGLVDDTTLFRRSSRSAAFTKMAEAARPRAMAARRRPGWTALDLEGDWRSCIEGGGAGRAAPQGREADRAAALGPVPSDSTVYRIFRRIGRATDLPTLRSGYSRTARSPGSTTAPENCRRHAGGLHPRTIKKLDRDGRGMEYLWAPISFHEKEQDVSQ